jgi:hypothetical protein
MGHWGGSTENHYAEGWVSAVSAGASDTNWRIYAASGNSYTDSWQMYVNGVQTYSNSNGSAGPNGPGINCNLGEHSNGQCGIFMIYGRVLSTTFNFRIGADVNGGGEPFTGNIHSVKVYNKLLTATEVIQNFNSQRDRYGL